VILITGINGFLGKSLINYLPKNYKYLFVTRKKINKNLNLNFKNIYTKNLFIEKFKWWKKKLKNVKVIIHLAWDIKNKNYKSSKKNLMCQLGSLTIANSAIEAGVKKFIMMGSILELEDRKNLYSKSKIETLKLLKMKFKSTKVIFKWLRISYLYGENEQSFKLKTYIEESLRNKKKIILKNPKMKHDFIEVNNACKQIIRHIFKNKNKKIISYIKSNKKITVENFTKYIKRKYKENI
jgi:dTDP-6-deoxy-L-talose 4-dehydrogenase (NAD+)